METRELFAALSDITDALQAEAARLRFSPTRLALEALVARLDGLIDQVVDGAGEGSEGVREQARGGNVGSPDALPGSSPLPPSPLPQGEEA